MQLSCHPSGNPTANCVRKTMDSTIFRTLDRGGFDGGVSPEQCKRTPADLIVYCLILLLGAITFTLYIKAPQELLDSRYSELARSILQRASYQFDFRPET